MYQYIKRFLDIAVSLVALIVLSPLLIVVAVWIRLDSKGPAVRVLERYGKNRKIFRIFKFRTMFIDAPKYTPPSELKNAASYITRAGRILRKISVDELPQLVNVLKGEMSFVGPRPGASINEESLAKERDKHNVFSVRPGIMAGLKLTDVTNWHTI